LPIVLLRLTEQKVKATLCNNHCFRYHAHLSKLSYYVGDRQLSADASRLTLIIDKSSVITSMCSKVRYNVHNVTYPSVSRECLVWYGTPAATHKSLQFVMCFFRHDRLWLKGRNPHKQSWKLHSKNSV